MLLFLFFYFHFHFHLVVVRIYYAIKNYGAFFVKIPIFSEGQHWINIFFWNIDVEMLSGIFHFIKLPLFEWKRECLDFVNDFYVLTTPINKQYSKNNVQRPNANKRILLLKWAAADWWNFFDQNIQHEKFCCFLFHYCKINSIQLHAWRKGVNELFHLVRISFIYHWKWKCSY